MEVNYIFMSVYSFNLNEYENVLYSLYRYLLADKIDSHNGHTFVYKFSAFKFSGYTVPGGTRIIIY